jgi:hypothetical protein
MAWLQATQDFFDQFTFVVGVKIGVICTVGVTVDVAGFHLVFQYRPQLSETLQVEIKKV